jgi:hypothetical protein
MSNTSTTNPSANPAQSSHNSTLNQSKTPNIQNKPNPVSNTPLSASTTMSTATTNKTTSSSSSTSSSGGGASNPADKESRWIFAKEKIENSPSRLDGISIEDELNFRQDAAILITDLGAMLKV